MKYMWTLATCYFLFNQASTQPIIPSGADWCATMKMLRLESQQDPSSATNYQQQQLAFNKYIISTGLKKNRRTTSFIYIPVVFHIVLPDPAAVSETQILIQLKILNQDFSGTNPDTMKIPSYFKSLLGRSTIQFCLAQTTPAGQPTSGIERVQSNTIFGISNAVKHSASGGADSWNTNSYFNVWITNLAGNTTFGISTFPGEGLPEDQGVIINYKTLPGGEAVNRNMGRTLTHETGHYFNLHHLAGDGGYCASDSVDDTPTQETITTTRELVNNSTFYSGIVNDHCTPTGYGIMYQDFMDYSYDDNRFMFTLGQVQRMEAALNFFRPSLAVLQPCVSPDPVTPDVELSAISNVDQRICVNQLNPQVVLTNTGTVTLSSLLIEAYIDNNKVTTYNWNGSLSPKSTASVTLSSIIVDTGNHVLTITASKPNGQSDQNPINNYQRLQFQYYQPQSELSESFEGYNFPPAGWGVVNPDKLFIWKQSTTASKSGVNSTMVENINYKYPADHDDLRLPPLTINTGPDSAFLSFNVAAANTTIGTATLQVLVSTDCGANFDTLYNKSGVDLATTKPTDSYFIPLLTDWRKDSVNLSRYIGNPNLMISFRSINLSGNNTYLDDVSLRTVNVNPLLRSDAILISPNPVSRYLAVQFYPQPSGLKAIYILNSIGQKVKEIQLNGNANNRYDIDVSNQPKGVYIITVLFENTKLVKKFMKL